MKISTFRLTSHFLLAAGLTLQLSSCVSTEHETSRSSVDPRVYSPPPARARARISSKTVLNTVTKTHVFSNPQAPDKFVLQLRGPRILTGQVHLIVTSSTGDTLRHEVMPARTLISEKVLNDPPSASVRDQEIAILQGMNNFFSDAHFSAPAVPANSEQPAEVDTKTWAALIEDPAIIGFNYTGAGGSGRCMAYVRKLGKAVVIVD